MKKTAKKTKTSRALGAEALKSAEQPQPPKPELAAQAAEEEEKLERAHFDRILVAGFFVFVLMLVAIAAFLFVSHGSLTKIYVGSIPINAGMSEVQIKQKIAGTADSYRLNLQYPDGSKKAYKLGDVGVTIDAASSAKTAKQIMDQVPVIRLIWWKPINVSLTTKTVHDALQSFITTHATEVRTVAANAALSVNAGTVILTPEKAGAGNALKNAPHQILTTVTGLKNQTLLVESAKLPPQITAKDLQASKAKAETIVAQKVVFSIDGKEVTAKPADIGSWVELTPVESAKTVDVTLNSGKVLEYINQIARPYIQPPRSKLITYLTDGSVVVLDNGANGIDVVNKDKTAADVAQKILQGKGAKVDLPVNYASAQTVEVEPYDKWIVADVTTKRMYAYEKTNLIRSFLVSAGAPKTPTVIGKYAVYAKYRSQDMRGLNADGSRYFQPNVQYVNYFYADYAIHGNYWRPLSYFGNINSSHGCIGIVDDDAAWVYDWAPIGTPVIVHK